MILGRNVEQDEMTCHLQECQLLLSYFCNYLPFLFKFDFEFALQHEYPSEYFDDT